MLKLIFAFLSNRISFSGNPAASSSVRSYNFASLSCGRVNPSSRRDRELLKSSVPTTSISQAALDTYSTWTWLSTAAALAVAISKASRSTSATAAFVFFFIADGDAAALPTDTVPASLLPPLFLPVTPSLLVLIVESRRSGVKLDSVRGWKSKLYGALYLYARSTVPAIPPAVVAAAAAPFCNDAFSPPPCCSSAYVTVRCGHSW
mmetsp:Transcript_29845/g.50419  ORF Transcript_29845/g.50419 Transcript_29845/m.50419 type:complete len:205 (-) Transcript_29845:1820-2434(-)